MVKKPVKVLLDTNVLISALIFGGKPEQTYNLVLDNQITAITSTILLAELTETLLKKFNFESIRITQLERIIKKHFKIVYSSETFHIQKDEPDNRVLEASVEGECDYIVTGDKELLTLATFKKIKIVTANQFLEILEEV